MQARHAPLSRPSAEWISRYAARLLDSTPGMHPLDAVRQAMEASAASADGERSNERRAPLVPPRRTSGPS
jgi:hypothetical protein